MYKKREFCQWSDKLHSAHIPRAKFKLKLFMTKNIGSFFFVPSRITFSPREMHRTATRFASYWPFAVASAARDAFTHTRITINLSRHTPHHITDMPSFPTDGANAFSQLDVRIRLAHLQVSEIYPQRNYLDSFFGVSRVVLLMGYKLNELNKKNIIWN